MLWLAIGPSGKGLAEQHPLKPIGVVAAKWSDDFWPIRGDPRANGHWVAAIVWMGTACLLNARRSGRTHCRFTGPYYLAMIAPSLALGIVDAPLYAWLVLAAFILLGDKIIWWSPMD